MKIILVQKMCTASQPEKTGQPATYPLCSRQQHLQEINSVWIYQGFPSPTKDKIWKQPNTILLAFLEANQLLSLNGDSCSLRLCPLTCCVCALLRYF